MRINTITANIMVKSVEDTIEFYTKALHFKLAMQAPAKGALNWCMLTNNGASIMFQKITSFKEEYPNMLPDKAAGGFTLYFDCEDIEDEYGRLKNKAPVIKELHKTFYGKLEFAIEDNNGFTLVYAGH